MAFVYRTDRTINLSGKQEATVVGPGAYIGHSEFKVKPQA